MIVTFIFSMVESRDRLANRPNFMTHIFNGLSWPFYWYDFIKNKTKMNNS